MSGSAASLFGDVTLHSACKLNCNPSNISYEEDWQLTILLFVDEISFMKETDLRKLDQYMRILTGNKDLLFGGIILILIGDFFQIPPQGKTALYHNISLQWSSLNKVIYLKNSHRFKKDPRWGNLLSRYRIGKYTEEDIEK